MIVFVGGNVIVVSLFREKRSSCNNYKTTIGVQQMRCPSLRDKKNTGADVFFIQCKLYVRKTEKNRNEIRPVPASKLCILKPGHLEFEASKKENLRKLKEAIEQGTKGEMNGFVNVVRS